MMNPGPVDEAGKAVGTFMEIMKAQPLSLALVAMNLALLGFFFFLTGKLADQRRHEMDAMHQEQKEVRELLARCVVQPPRTDLQIQIPAEGIVR